MRWQFPGMQSWVRTRDVWQHDRELCEFPTFHLLISLRTHFSHSFIYLLGPPFSFSPTYILFPLSFHLQTSSSLYFLWLSSTPSPHLSYYNRHSVTSLQLHRGSVRKWTFSLLIFTLTHISSWCVRRQQVEFLISTSVQPAPTTLALASSLCMEHETLQTHYILDSLAPG